MGEADDVEAIEALIARQFASMNWRRGETGDWAAFAADFLAGAPLYPSARPLGPTDVPSFVGRMQQLSRSNLREFSQRVGGVRVQVFGNVAVALAVCDNVENGTRPSRGVEALLLVRCDEGWRIAAQAWDMESDAKRVPSDLRDRRPGMSPNGVLGIPRK